MNRELPRVLHYYRDAPRVSGVTTALRWLQESATRSGFETQVAHAENIGTWPSGGRSIRHIGRGRLGQVPSNSAWLDDADVLVLHEGWTPSNHIAAAMARQRGVPYIVVPHGVYEPGIMKGLRALALRAPAERTYLQNAAAVHCFFPGEERLVRKLAPAVKWSQSIPLGHSMPDAQWAREGSYLAWFGRSDLDHKGLDRLLFGLALVPPANRPRLELRVQEFGDGLSKIINLVHTLGLGKFVGVGTAVYGDEKVQFLREASAFVFPSRWEGYGIALVEALAMGVPTVIDPDIQLAESLRRSGASFAVPFDNYLHVGAALASASNDAELGARGRAFVSTELDWDRLDPIYKSFLLRIGGTRA